MLEVNVTPNRGDAMSVLGIAREVAALAGIVAQGRRRQRPGVAQHRDRHGASVGDRRNSKQSR